MKLTKTEFKVFLTKVHMLASIAASFTPTPKDDAAVALIAEIINNQTQFDALCQLLGITE